MLDCSPTLLPEWLSALLSEKFFNACIAHEDARKNEKNIFCLDCCEAICPHCVTPHSRHRLLQIRRYVYHDVIKLSDAEKLLDCGFVQSYTNNSAKVVFLNQRPLSRPCRGSGNTCLLCDRMLQHPYFFCSIYCKLQHLVRTGCQLSEYIHKCDTLTLHELGLEDGLMTPDTVLEPVGSVRTDSGGSGSGGGGAAVDCRILCSIATTEVVRKKRSTLLSIRSELRPGCGPVSEISGSMMNRRKGTPHRSPLY